MTHQQTVEAVKASLLLAPKKCDRAYEACKPRPVPGTNGARHA